MPNICTIITKETHANQICFEVLALKEKRKIILAGVVIGVIAAALVWFGNPKNMGFCIACFIRDTAGAVGMHQAAVVQYIRPEIIGLVLGALIVSAVKKEFLPRGGSSPMTRFVLGAFVMSVCTKEFRAKSGSAPALRFVLGAFVMIGALAFLGCPLRMVLRLAGGDANALVGLVGFGAGIFAGTLFLKKGFSLKRSYDSVPLEGVVLPVSMTVILLLFLTVPVIFKLSEAGPGSKHAPVWLALALSMVIGALAQRSRLCMAGGIRDAVMFGDFKLLSGFVAIFLVALIGNLVTKQFHWGFQLQPIAHSSHVWNFLGMTLVGWGSVLLGGCPLRQLILAGSGNGDSTVTVFGMLAGAAAAHNFGLAGTADSTNAAGEFVRGGLSNTGKIAVVSGIVVCLAVSVLNLPKFAKKQEAK